MLYLYWILSLPLSSAALTPIGPLRLRPRPKSWARAVGRRGESPALALGWGEAVAAPEKAEKEKEPGQ